MVYALSDGTHDAYSVWWISWFIFCMMEIMVHDLSGGTHGTCSIW